MTRFNFFLFSVICAVLDENVTENNNNPSGSGNSNSTIGRYIIIFTIFLLNDIVFLEFRRSFEKH